MNHPVMHGVDTTEQYGSAPPAPAPGQYGALPPTPPPGADWQPPPPQRRRRWVVPALVGGTAVVALVAGVTLGAVFSGGGNDSGASTAGPAVSEPANAPAGAPPSATEVHAQDVSLCTSYAIINTAIPTPDTSGSDLLPAVAALQTALAENPNASAPVRVAVTDMTSVYEARIAAHGGVRARGLAEPPLYTVEGHKAASAQVWAVCGLDEE